MSDKSRMEGQSINDALRFLATDELDVGAIHGTVNTLGIKNALPLRDIEQAFRFLHSRVEIAQMLVEYAAWIIRERDHYKKVAEDLLDTRLPAHIVLGGGETWEKVYYAHLGHVQQFLKDMHATMADPVEDFHGTVEQLCAELLKIAREQREELNARE